MATVLRSVRIRVENDARIQSIVKEWAEQGVKKKYNKVVNEILSMGLHAMPLPEDPEDEDEG